MREGLKKKRIFKDIVLKGGSRKRAERVGLTLLIISPLMMIMICLGHKIIMIIVILIDLLT